MWLKVEAIVVVQAISEKEIGVLLYLSYRFQLDGPVTGDLVAMEFDVSKNELGRLDANP